MSSPQALAGFDFESEDSGPVPIVFLPQPEILRCPFFGCILAFASFHGFRHPELYRLFTHEQPQPPLLRPTLKTTSPLYHVFHDHIQDS
jgi:hypothetical protein